jgi:predicted ribosomally synthesized peptide with SipW-like signal peptide
LKKRKWTKAALVFSSLLFVLWWALGTGATLAWFSDVDEVRNEFQIGLLDLDVEYKNDIQTVYTPMLPTSEVFYDKALYEPGYTQVVYLKIKNNGNVDFQYKVAVTVNDSESVPSVLGNSIYLPDYLRYGVVFAKTEAELQELVKERLRANNAAQKPWGRLETWSEISPYTFDVVNDGEHYAALIVRMPEDVGNVANYRGGEAPWVELGITVFAQQADAPME